MSGGKMSVSEEVKYKILNELQNGFSATSLSLKYDVTAATILRWNKEFKDALLNNDMSSLINVDKAILGELSDKLKEGAVSADVDKVVDGLQGLQVLQTDMQSTAAIINNRLKKLSHSTESIGELVMLTDCLCSLQSSFFNKNLTQVNVQNNYGESDDKYAAFLSDAPNA